MFIHFTIITGLSAVYIPPAYHFGRWSCKTCMGVERSGFRLCLEL